MTMEDFAWWLNAIREHNEAVEAQIERAKTAAERSRN